MRHLRKRLTCVNHDDRSIAKKRIAKVVYRYCKKMMAHGWIPDFSNMTNGNSFFQYEAYISMYKTTKKDIRENKTSFIKDVEKENRENAQLYSDYYFKLYS